MNDIVVLNRKLNDINLAIDKLTTKRIATLRAEIRKLTKQRPKVKRPKLSANSKKAACKNCIFSNPFTEAQGHVWCDRLHLYESLNHVCSRHNFRHK